MGDPKGSFWKDIAPILFAEALDHGSLRDLRYDAIVVDEAQDFRTDWWLPVEMLLKDVDQSPLHIFLDPSQCIYGELLPAIKMSFTYHLNENCRNTRCIIRYCGQVIHKTLQARTGTPNGVRPVILQADPSRDGRAQRVRSVVQSWMDERITANRIAVLSPWAKENVDSTLGSLQQVGSVALSDRESSVSDWTEGRVLLGTTIKAFKGMEADCVVITDVPRVGSAGFQAADLYVAASRAKLRLTIIPSTPQAAEQLASWVSKEG